MDAERVSEYLDRIGGAAPGAPDAEALTALMERHLESVPFENLSVHFGEPNPADEDGLFDKLVRRRRGGICYELNGGFADLLEALGFDVARLAARGVVDGVLGPPFDHETLVVATTGRRWLIDVGFGRFARAPLDLDSVAEQYDTDGVYTLTPADEGDVDVHRDGELVYRIEMRPRRQEDFLPTFCWHSVSPASPFTRTLTCSLPVRGGGRVTLTGDRLIRTERDGTRAEEKLPSAELVAVYRDRFGVELDRVPPVRYPRSEVSSEERDGPDTAAGPGYGPGTNSALVVVDMQNAFVAPTGSAAVDGADAVVVAVNRRVADARARGRPVLYTRDVDPTGLTGPDADHDSALYPGLDVDGVVVDKGPGVSGGYSGFVHTPPGARDAPGGGGLGALAARLRDADVDHVVVVGLALDVCVAATARDARRLGYAVDVDLGAAASVQAHPHGDAGALDELRAAGVRLLDDGAPAGGSR